MKTIQIYGEMFTTEGQFFSFCLENKIITEIPLTILYMELMQKGQLTILVKEQLVLIDKM